MLSGGRITLGTGTLYTMVGRLTADGVIVTLPGREKKTYQITQEGMALLTEETERLERQLADGRKMLSGGVFTVPKRQDEEQAAENSREEVIFV